MKIGVISDTHVPVRAKALPATLWVALADVELILHAGDLVDTSVIDELSALAPVLAVHGNVDPPEVQRRLPDRRLIEVAGCRIGLLHGHGPGRTHPTLRALQAFPAAHCVVFGHTHVPYNGRHGQTLLFNPGSPTDRRRMPRCSYGILHVEGERVWGQICWL